MAVESWQNDTAVPGKSEWKDVCDKISTGNTVELLNSCRVCMLKKDVMCSIYSNTQQDVCHKLEFCTGLQFNREDGKPSSICVQCLETLNIAHSFKVTCLKSYETFQKLLESNIKEEIKEYSDDECDVNFDNNFEDVHENETKENGKLIVTRKSVRRTPNASYTKDLIKTVDTSKNETDVEISTEKSEENRLYCKLCDVTFADEKECNSHVEHVGMDHNNVSEKHTEHPSTDVEDGATEEAGLYVDVDIASVEKDEIMKIMKLKKHSASERKKRKKITNPLLKQELKPEVSQQSEQRKYRRLFCQMCDIKFTTKTESDEHKRSVHSEDKFVCEYCGKTFNKRGAQYSHSRTHRPPEFPCTDCDYRAYHKHDLAKHQSIHTGEKKHKCQYCENIYRNRSNLMSHVRRTHRGEKRYACHLCHKAYFDKTKLNRHLDTHNDVKRFSCHICHSMFSRRCYWKKHLWAQHAVEIPRPRPGRRNTTQGVQDVEPVNKI